MKNEQTIRKVNIISREIKEMTAKEAYKEITKTVEGRNLCDEWAVEDEFIFEDILEGAGTLELGNDVYSYNKEAAKGKVESPLAKMERKPFILTAFEKKGVSKMK